MENFELEELQKQGCQALEDFTNYRLRQVEEGKETPELAGLMTYNYGTGLAKMLEVLASFKNFLAPSLDKDVVRCVSKVDPNWESSRSVRYLARPAGLSLPPEMPQQ